MASVVFILASLCPALLWALRAMLFRRLTAARRLAFDFALFLVSVPLAVRLIERALDFPANMGDHSPGAGIAFLPFVIAWMSCMAIWLFRLAWFALRRPMASD